MSRATIATIGLLVLLATAAPAQAPAANRLVAHLYAKSHHPRVNKPFPIRITATDPSGRPVRATVDYQYLYGGQIVARRSHYRFKGTFRDSLVFPAASVGYRLTFRAVIKSAIGNRNLDWWVEVKR